MPDYMIMESSNSSRSFVDVARDLQNKVTRQDPKEYIVPVVFVFSKYNKDLGRRTHSLNIAHVRARGSRVVSRVERPVDRVQPSVHLDKVVSNLYKPHQRERFKKKKKQQNKTTVQSGPIPVDKRKKNGIMRELYHLFSWSWLQMSCIRRSGAVSPRSPGCVAVENLAAQQGRVANSPPRASSYPTEGIPTFGGVDIQSEEKAIVISGESMTREDLENMDAAIADMLQQQSDRERAKMKEEAEEENRRAAAEGIAALGRSPLHVRCEELGHNKCVCSNIASRVYFQRALEKVAFQGMHDGARPYAWLNRAKELCETFDSHCTCVEAPPCHQCCRSKLFAANTRTTAIRARQYILERKPFVAQLGEDTTAHTVEERSLVDALNGVVDRPSIQSGPLEEEEEHAAVEEEVKGFGRGFDVDGLADMLKDCMKHVQDLDATTVKVMEVLQQLILFWYLDVPNMKGFVKSSAYLYRLAVNILGERVYNSVYPWLCKMIQSLGDEDPSVQSGSLDEVNWYRTVMSSEAMVKMSKFMSAMVSVCFMKNVLTGLKDSEGKPVQLGETLFGELWSKFVAAFKVRDVISTVLEFAAWLLTSGIAWMRGDKSFESLFFQKDKARIFDDRVAQLDTWYKRAERKGHAEFLELYQECITLECIAQKQMRNIDDKRIRVVLARQLEKIRGHIDACLVHMSAESIRPQPFSVLVYGTSSVGKTVLLQQLVPMLQHAAGVTVGPHKEFHVDMNDKYWTGCKADANTYVLDDISNTILDYAEKIPSDFVIAIINNYKRFAIMADLDEKGKIPIAPSIVVATTNRKDLQAGLTSVSALSILRRFEYHITMKVKDACGYGPPGKKMFKRDNHAPSDHGYDCWTFTVETVEPHHESEPVQYKVVQGMENVNICQLSKFLTQECKKHTARQAHVVNIMKNMASQPLCEHHIFKHLCEDCRCEQEPSTQSGVEQDMNLEDPVEPVVVERMQIARVENAPLPPMEREPAPGELMGTFMFRLAQQFAWAKSIGSRAHPIWSQFIDELTRQAEGGSRIARAMLTAFGPMMAAKIALGYTEFRASGGSFVPQTSCVFYSGVISAFLWLVLGYFVALPCIFAVVFTYMYVVSTFMYIFRYVPLNARQTLSHVVRNVTTSVLGPYQNRVKPVLIGIAVVVACYKGWRYLEKERETQGSKVSLPVPRGVSQRKDPWRPPPVTAKYRNFATRTWTAQQMGPFLQERLRGMVAYKNGKQIEHCATIAVCTNFWLAPYHMMSKEPDEAKIVYRSTDAEHSMRHVKLRGSWRRIGQTDMCLVYIPGLGDERDIRDFFPEKHETYKSIGAVCIWSRMRTRKREDSDDSYILMEKGHAGVPATSGMVKPMQLDFSYFGGSYTAPVPTYQGMCGSLLITDGKAPYILGVHSAGITGRHLANYCSLTREDVNATIGAMTSPETAMMEGIPSGDLEECLDFEGTVFRFKNEIPNNSVITHTQGGLVLVHGMSTEPKRTFRSAVKPTIIAEDVSEEFNVPIAHGAPRYINHWAPANVWVTNVSNPSDEHQCWIDMAYKDYRDHVLSGLPEGWREKVHPLDEDAVLAGFDGVKGCYAINYNTSMGIPLCRPKHEFIKPSDRKVEGISCPRDMPQYLRDNIADFEQKLKKSRVYFPFRCNRKDEPTKLEKDKVRIFQGGRFEYLYLMRKYFLTFSMLMQENPELFECAVGVNATSMEWTILGEYIAKYGVDRIVAGDFKGYDQKLSARVLMAAFKFILHCLELAGYDEDQLLICRALAVETVMAMYNMEGTWLQPNAGNPSGHSLTVVLNSIGNSLEMRSKFYKLWSRHVEVPRSMWMRLSRPDPPAFADFVALMTYGDDNIMSVHKSAGWFNHTTIAAAFAESGMEYTMADKQKESVPYIHFNEAEFLKRKWVWDDRLKRYLCPLLESSIFKSLVCALESDMLTKEEHAAEIMTGALREFYFHGQRRFDEARERFVRIAKKHDLMHHFIGGKLLHYDEIEEWYLEQ